MKQNTDGIHAPDIVIEAIQQNLTKYTIDKQLSEQLTNPLIRA